MAYTDDAVRERHGMRCSTTTKEWSQVTIEERDATIVLSRNHDTRELTPWQAKYLASKLFRLARRAQRRIESDLS